jgi:hypothetical protein
VALKVQVTGMVRPNTTVLKVNVPRVKVAVPAWSGVQVPDSVTVTLEPLGTAPCEPAVTVTGFWLVPVVAMAWLNALRSLIA